jgi:transcriptional regulator with XRE-family HTH domain
MNGTELREWRKLLGLTQEQAAKEFEVTRATVQNWEYGITSVPRAIELASRQILRLWKRRLDFGPVTLAYAMPSLMAAAIEPESLPVLFCERYPNNKAALLACPTRIGTRDFSSLFILDDGKSVIWSGKGLLEECDKLKGMSETDIAGRQQ